MHLACLDGRVSNRICVARTKHRKGALPSTDGSGIRQNQVIGNDALRSQMPPLRIHTCKGITGRYLQHERAEPCASNQAKGGMHNMRLVARGRPELAHR